MTRVLLTGARGFVGGQILKALLARGADVRAVLRGDHDLPGQVEIVRTPDLFAEPEAWWLDQMLGIDRVIHAAWFVKPVVYLTAKENTDCLTGSLTQFRAFLKSDVPHWTGLGTCFEYAFRDTALTTDAPLGPETPYAAAKASLGLATTGLTSTHEKTAAWCRLFFLYGENEHHSRLVPAIRRALAAAEVLAMTSGNQIRDYMDVADAGAQIAHASLTTFAGMANICSGKSRTVHDIAMEIAAEYDGAHLLNFGARPDNLSDPPCVLGVPSFPQVQGTY